MSARLEHKMDKDKNITELFIDSESKNICMLRLGRSLVGRSNYDSNTTELQLMMYSLVKAINSGLIEVVVD